MMRLPSHLLFNHQCDQRSETTLEIFMFKRAAIGLAALCIASSAAFAQCTRDEMADAQAAFTNYTRTLLNGGNVMNALSDLQADLDDLSLSSACRAFVYSQMGGGGGRGSSGSGRRGPDRVIDTGGQLCSGGVCVPKR
jgi:hypothetical protein